MAETVTPAEIVAFAETTPTAETIPVETIKMPRITLHRTPLSKIEDGIYLSDKETSRTREIIQENKITAMVSLVVDYWRPYWHKESIDQLFIPTKDSMTHDMLPDLARICDFIDTYRNTESPDGGLNSVLVHCDLGISRSSTATIAYLMRTHKWSFSDTLAFVREKRRIMPNENFKEQLQVWEAVAYEIWADEKKKTPKPEYAAFLEKRAVRLTEAGLTGNEPIEPPKPLFL
ncbi:hypothetical protein ABW20_dc0104716 [Dactylellina cionopaga]|nr:hypothetical protein ABW20_dc0104716 [Dactylellina cionopaga]